MQEECKIVPVKSSNFLGHTSENGRIIQINIKLLEDYAKRAHIEYGIPVEKLKLYNHCLLKSIVAHEIGHSYYCFIRGMPGTEIEALIIEGAYAMYNSDYSTSEEERKIWEKIKGRIIKKLKEEIEQD